MQTAREWGSEIANRTSIKAKHSFKRYHLIVNLNIADSYGDGLIETICDLVVDLSHGSGDYAAILVLGAASSHGEGLARTCLTVTHNSAVVALDH